MSHENKSYAVDDGECMTRCNHRMYANVNGTKKKNYVGSGWCKKSCPNHVSSDENTVTCSFIGDACDRARMAAKDGPNV